MAYQRRPRQEDPNTGLVRTGSGMAYRPDPTSPPRATGGAPRQIKSTLGGMQERATQYKPVTGTPLRQERNMTTFPGAPRDIVYPGVPKSTLGGEDPGLGYERPPLYGDGAWRPPHFREGYMPPRDDPNWIAPAPKFRLDEVRNQNPEFVRALREKLLQMYKSSTPQERANNQVFWDTVRSNPEGAASAVAARILENTNPFLNENAPQMNEAVKARIKSSRISLWLAYADRYRGY